MPKFLSYEERIIIAQRLQENASFGAIPYNPCKFSLWIQLMDLVLNFRA